MKGNSNDGYSREVSEAWCCSGSCAGRYKDAVPLAKALVEGGLPCAEVTFRTEAAEESIRLMTEQFPEMLVGAGTVLTREQVDAAVAAGAKVYCKPWI